MNTLTFVPEGEWHRYRIKETGDLVSIPSLDPVVTIQNHSAGILHSAHPNISVTGSIAGMRKYGWRKTDLVHRQGAYHYNVSMVVTSHLLDKLCLALEDPELKCFLSIRFLEDGSQVFTF